MEKMVFIADDNDANLTVAAAALENEFNVLTMPSAKRMFMLLEKKLPDLILLDIEMPEMSGLEAIAKLRENPRWKDIPVLFLTGWCDETLKTNALASGALDVIMKPVEPAALLDYARKYIGE